MAEKMIKDKLNSINALFYQEVMFQDCINPKTGIQLRYDFYLPEQNILIEYDGKAFHTSDDVKYRDSIKDKFAKTNGIRLVRMQGFEGAIHWIDKHLGYLKGLNAGRSLHKEKKKHKHKKAATTGNYADLCPKSEKQPDKKTDLNWQHSKMIKGKRKHRRIEISKPNEVPKPQIIRFAMGVNKKMV